jgi:type IX secretion system PorP/SprF family membrane protein
MMNCNTLLWSDKIKVLFIFLACLTTLNAQQTPQYSQYLRNQFMVNPGAAGIYDFTDITMSGRWQWIGFGDEPRTAFLSVTAPLSITKRIPYNPALRISNGPVRNPEIKTGKIKHAIGGTLVADQYGAFRKLQFSGTYAIHLPITKTYNMSFGTRIGLSNNTFLADKAQVLNVVDPGLGYTDDTYDNFIQDQTSKFILDIGAGLYVYSNRFFIGVAADQLTKNMVNFGSASANFDPQMYFNATGGIKLKANDNFTITPAFILKYMTPAPISLEATLQVEYKEWLWAGVSYRNTDAIVGMVGLNINKKLKFGYSYDYSVSRFNQYSSGGHELVLGIMLGR